MTKHPDSPSGETACPARPARRDKTGSPYRLDLHALPGNPGSRLEFDWRFPLSPEWTNSVVRLEGTEIPCRVELTAVSEGILAHITGEVGTVAQCSRCLDPVHEVLSLDETQMFFFPESLDSAREQAGEDSVDILEVSDDNQIDLEPLLRDNLVLALPNLPLCDENCRGLCPDCGERLDMLPADHHHENIDPRWAALGDLAKSLRENPEGEN
ncbi:hypothetical protein HHJ78_03790 [Mobiluncus mulieris]|uniref:DUF177 domain-containing protein n=1 Tax=Mobiluncus mulieris TaxID=2052 RepID=A0A7Y0Y3V3_9ACTO|nr:YceD family protein [Mobiluncus mulieris]NMW64670.1 hypothetical protein [Mobiluncus mulieris]